jgi:exopolyphosphatase/guanosine-5'-triphosphate,3'-diphosphate pyrophosphatase
METSGMHIAIIDIGTNTFDLLISEIVPGQKPKECYNDKISVRLGAGSLQKHILTEAAIERALQALKFFTDIINSYHCKHTYAFGTSALRDAKNKSVFTDLVKKEFNIDITIIDGDKEAGYIYKGVQHALDIGGGNAVIMDIGGGSIEFIIASNQGIVWEKSFNIGVARILEKFSASDPILPDEQQKIERFLESELQQFFEALKVHKAITLIGSSGSFETFASIVAHQFHTPSILEDVIEYTFDLQEYEAVHHQLMASSLKDRKQMMGIIEMRLDMIVMASLVTHFIIKKTGMSAMRMSTYSLKEGVLWDLIEKQTDFKAF